MDKRKKSPPISMFVMIAVIGLVISIINGDFDLSPYFEDLDSGTIETLLDVVNIGLAFLALAGVAIFLIWRSARGKKELYWEFDKDQDQESNETGVKRQE